jgi:hypothetical protein
MQVLLANQWELYAVNLYRVVDLVQKYSSLKLMYRHKHKRVNLKMPHAMYMPSRTSPELQSHSTFSSQHRTPIRPVNNNCYLKFKTGCGGLLFL